MTQKSIDELRRMREVMKNLRANVEAKIEDGKIVQAADIRTSFLDIAAAVENLSRILEGET